MIPLLSCTAPRWEDKQDEMEKVSLSEEEKKAIEDDIFGNRAITREAPAMVAQARTLIQDAIDLIPDEQKEAYFRALVQCPELVRSESEPLRFLRCEAFNAWDTARRLVRYWGVLKKIFGDRAYLPVVQTGNGALTAEEVELMRRGPVMVLPKDASQRTVMYVFKSCLDEYPRGRQQLIKCVFYMFSVALEDELSQKHGVVLISDLRDLPSQNNKKDLFERKVTKLYWEVLRDCLPIRIHATHGCLPAEKRIAAIFKPFAVWMMGKDVRRRRVEHIGGPLVLLSSLEEYGFKQDGLPIPLGGFWGPDDFEDRTRRQLALELERERN